MNPNQTTTSPSTTPKTFEEFFPQYMALHAKPVTQWIHVSFTLLGFLLILSGALSGEWLWVVIAPVVIYGPLFLSHFLIEKNKPATFSHPLWSVRADFRMARLKISGLWRKQ